MKAAALIIVLAFAGCAGPPDPTAGVVAPEPTAVAQPVNVTAIEVPDVPPPATFATAGLHASACGFRDNAFFFKHEWAEGILPPEYRPINYQAGNVGSVSIQVHRCAGLAIGNESFVADRHVGVFGVPVEPPAEVRGADTNVYLFSLLLDDEPFARQVGAAGVPVQLATFTLDESRYEVAGPPAFVAEVTETIGQSQVANYTIGLRLHWKEPGRLCWLDAENRVETSVLTQATLEAKDGPILALSGPAHRLVGLGTHGTVSGHFGAPACVAA